MKMNFLKLSDVRLALLRPSLLLKAVWCGDLRAWSWLCTLLHFTMMLLLVFCYWYCYRLYTVC